MMWRPDRGHVRTGELTFVVVDPEVDAGHRNRCSEPRRPCRQRPRAHRVAHGMGDPHHGIEASQERPADGRRRRAPSIVEQVLCEYEQHDRIGGGREDGERQQQPERQFETTDDLDRRGDEVKPVVVRCGGHGVEESVWRREFAAHEHRSHRQVLVPVAHRHPVHALGCNAPVREKRDQDENSDNERCDPDDSRGGCRSTHRSSSDAEQ